MLKEFITELNHIYQDLSTIAFRKVLFEARNFCCSLHKT